MFTLGFLESEESLRLSDLTARAVSDFTSWTGADLADESDACFKYSFEFNASNNWSTKSFVSKINKIIL